MSYRFALRHRLTLFFLAGALAGIFLLFSIPLAGAAVFERTLKQGSEGTDVSALQELLKSQGFFTYPSITGYFGPATEQAVTDFQRANGLPGVGVVGPQTRALLNGISVSGMPVESVLATSSEPFTFSRSLAFGMQGEDVSALQRLLRDLGFFTYPSITGYFGEVTEAALKLFQMSKGLDPVGRVGPLTGALLTILTGPPLQVPEPEPVRTTQRSRGGGSSPAILLSSSAVSEGAAVGDTVGTLSVTDDTRPYTFALTATAGGRFSVDGEALKVASALDYETNTSHSITVQATNTVNGVVLERSFTITVTDVEYEDADTQALFAAMDTEPGAGDKARYNAVIVGLKAASLWDKIDVLQIYAAHDSGAALINWKDPGTFDATVVNSPTFTAYTGFTTNGTDSEVNTNFNPTLATQLTQNSLHVGLWHTSSGTAATSGWFDGTDGITINARDTSDRIVFRAAQALTTTESSPAVTTSAGFTAINRSASNATQLYKNSVALSPETNNNQTSTALNDETLRIGRSSSSAYAAVTAAVFVAGSSLTATEHEALYNILNAYMTVAQAAEGEILDNTPSAGSIANNAHAIADDDYTYLGSVRFTNGAQVVHRISHDTGEVDQSFTVSSAYPADDHMTPVLNLLSDNRLVTLYTGHGEDGTVRFRRSTDASPLNFGSEITALSLSDTTYVRLFVNGGNIFAITQEANGSSSGGWDIAKSTDDGDTWTRKKRLFRGTTGFSTAQFYVRFSESSPSSDDIVVGFAHAHENNSQNKLTVLTLNMDTGEVRYSGGSAGTIDDGSNDTPLTSYNDMTAIRTPAASRTHSMQVAKEDGSRIIVADFLTATDTDRKIYLGKYDGSSDITTAAAWSFNELSLGTGTTTGFKFDERDSTGNTIFFIRNNSGTYTIEKWTSADDGDTWSLAETLNTTSTNTLKPVQPRNPSNSLPLLWAEGTYTNFDDQDLDTFW